MSGKRLLCGNLQQEITLATRGQASGVGEKKDHYIHIGNNTNNFHYTAKPFCADTVIV